MSDASPNPAPTAAETTTAGQEPGAPSAQWLREHELRGKLRTWRIMAIIFAVATIALAVLVVLQATVLRPAASGAAPGGAPAATEQAGGDSAAPDDGRPLAEKVARGDAADPMAFGDPDAPVTVVEWIDYRCPFCAVYTNDTLPTVMKEYVDTGKVRYEVHDVSFFGDDSTAAAVAARAAAQQGRFGEFMTVLYAAAPESGHPDMPRDKLIGFAKKAGVADIPAFEKALDDPAIAQQVAADTAGAQQMGVSSVPFFVIGDQTFAGAQPVDVFRTAIDEALTAAK